VYSLVNFAAIDPDSLSPWHVILFVTNPRPQLSGLKFYGDSLEKTWLNTV